MLLLPSTTRLFHSTMRHLRPGLSKNSKKGTTMRSCRSGRAGEIPQEGGRRGADDLVLKEQTGGRERREEVQSGGAEGDGVGGEGLAQGGVWDDAHPDPPAQRSS